MSRRWKKISAIESWAGFRLPGTGALLTVLLLVWGACSKDDGKPSAKKAHMITNIVYGERERHSLDLYLPANRTDATPLVVLVHGGGWCTGDKINTSLQAEYLQNSGYAAAAINYRFAGGVENLTVFAQVADIGRALDFLRQQSGFYTYSSEKPAMIGFSAGGHLALLFAYTEGHDRVSAVVGFAPATDFTDTNYIATGHEFFEMLTGTPFTAPNYHLYRDASPLWMSGSSAPPTLLFHGLLDEAIPCDHSLRLGARLDSLAVSNQVNILSGSGHAFESENMEALMQQCVLWFNSEL